MAPSDPGERPKLTLWQRLALRQIRRRAGKHSDEPLSEEDWAAVMDLHYSGAGRIMSRLFAALPGSPRCSMCAAPFAGPGRPLAAALGYRPSRKNPQLCVTCVESSPPGGVTVDTGVLFADLRGFTEQSEGRSPREVSETLREFYRCAEKVLFPDAVIDKLIGDEVMALYPAFVRRETGEETRRRMLEHAADLLRAVGYGSDEGPFAEVGIGLDYGPAFVGNIGDRSLHDFTAVGDVVNTASRLQGVAGGGEIVLSERVASGLGRLPGEPLEVEVKGKAEPVRARRMDVGAAAAAAQTRP